MSLVKRVLARTSGPACPSAEDRFVAFAEGELDAVDRDLVKSHLARCPGCREELARVREWLAELPQAAEVEPDPCFVDDVLRRTSRRPSRADAWRRLVLRPRFALEAAYVGAVVLLVIGMLADFRARAVPDLMRTVISDLKEKP